MAKLVFDDVSKEYEDGVLAVKHLDLDIEDGEFLVLLGPSGCGKTTALRMVAGLEEITAGEVRLDDRVLNDLEPQDRDVAMVFQNYALYPHMSVRGNIGFPLRQAKMPKDERDKKVESVAATLDLTSHLDKKPGQLSGGQRQRVAMGRAIAREPSLFLMDEPLSNLDATLRVQMRVEIHSVQRRLNTTTMYVTHDQTEAMTLGDRVAVMRDGVLQQIGTPHEVYDAPQNLFVARFLGNPGMNLFDGQLGQEGGKPLVRIGEQVMGLDEGERAAQPALAESEGRPVVVGVRPESMCLPEAADEGRRLRASVALTEDLGSNVLVYLTVPGVRPTEGAVTEGDVETPAAGTNSRDALALGRFSPNPGFTGGQEVELGLDPGAMRFFDAESGEAL